MRLPALLQARRFQTMWPVYFGLRRISQMLAVDHFPIARVGSGGG